MKNKDKSKIIITNSRILKSNNAITLVALVITIIVLLILSGITLNMIIGDNGIIAKAHLAKEKTNQAQELEDQKLKDLEEKLISSRNNGNYIVKKILDTEVSSGTFKFIDGYTLDDFDEIDFIYGEYGGNEDMFTYSSRYLTVVLKDLINDDNKKFVELGGYANNYINFTIKSLNEFEVRSNKNYRIFSIYGIKY